MGHNPEAREQVLVIDDEAGIRFFIRRVLERAGYGVLEAPNGLAGLDLFQRAAGAIRLVICDVQMPVMGGDDLIRALKAVSPDTRVLRVTGQQRGGLSADSATLVTLRKPFSAEDLLTAISRLTEGA